MKVKCTSVKFDYSGFTVGNEYKVLNAMLSQYGGQWMEVETDLEGIVSIIRFGGAVPDATGTWESVE